MTIVQPGKELGLPDYVVETMALSACTITQAFILLGTCLLVCFPDEWRKECVHFAWLSLLGLCDPANCLCSVTNLA